MARRSHPRNDTTTAEQAEVTCEKPVELSGNHSRDSVLGSTQRETLLYSAQLTFVRIVGLWVLVLLCTTVLTDTKLADLPRTVYEVATLKRLPITAQDNIGAAVAFLLSLLGLLLVDVTVCDAFCTDRGARWFLLHALGNLVAAALAVPDLFLVAKKPYYALSVRYCEGRAFPACSDWPSALIIAIHVYHVLRFKLSSDDLFHHMLFVPIIGGIHFAYPWGASGNMLCFFISGLPGGLDYIMLCAVKADHLTSYSQKRINCSIHTWLRSPGILTFTALSFSCWLDPPPDTLPSDVMPWYFALPCFFLIFFNAQYYAQRIIGNYYIFKAQDCQKRGISRVNLHAS
jgi:hypothetical protein